MKQETIDYIKETMEYNLKRIQYFGKTNCIMELTAQSNANSAINVLGHILELEGYDVENIPLNVYTTKTIHIIRSAKQ